MICGGMEIESPPEERMILMQNKRHALSAVTLEYMPRPADREIRTRTGRMDISVRGETSRLEGCGKGEAHD